MAASELTVRPLRDADMDRLIHVDNIAFLEEPYSPELIAWQRRFLEVDRSIGIFDGDTQVGGASIFTMQLTVPDARLVPLAGVTWVSMLPTHRRRGGLTKMMRHQLHDLHERGAEAIAGLTASHPAIYGRFGYGRPTQDVSLTVPRAHNALRLPDGVDDVTLRLVDPKSAISICQQKYAHGALLRPGMVSRPDIWFEFDAADLDQIRDDKSKLRLVLAERDGETVGYATYRTKSGSGSNGEVLVSYVYGDDMAAYAALWQMLLNVDLTSSTVVDGIPTDDPLFAMLESSRYAKPALHDGVYLRLVDVDRALSARTYAAPIDVVFEVTDAFCPWNAGRWRLVGDEKGATCTRTDSAADLAIDVRELASVYLGGITLRSLALANQVTELTTGAARAASRAFASDLAPWLSTGF
ncbi:MAG TPA: GNAT family N-acetyltransferase [Actinospica sp.]|jgi:predicted acetyltransferase|nr:GNAT family N-acetyltransferase [Actinospica sp.]